MFKFLFFVKVGPRTNHFQTQCFSTHLTTFAAGFLVLPAPVHLDRVFIETNFTKTKTLYMTAACKFTIYCVFDSSACIKDRHKSITYSSGSFAFDQYLHQIFLIIDQKKRTVTQSRVSLSINIFCSC